MKRQIAYLWILLAIWGCGEKQSAASNTGEDQSGYITISKEQFEANGMSLGNLEEKSFPLAVAANGIIDVPPENRATVSAIMGGYVQGIPLLVGDKVKKGQRLATLENPEYVALQQAYLEVRERLNYLKSEYDRQKVLFDENITSQKNYLKTESEYNTAIAQYKGLQKQLQLLNILPSKVEQGNITTTVSIYAPIAGNVTEVYVSKGTFVSPASPILEIVDHSHIHLELSVFERDVMKICKGQAITFRIPEASDKTFEAEVYLVGTAIGENRTIKVHGHLKEEEHHFLTGMYVEAQILTKTENAKALPARAIVEVEGAHHALRLVSQTAADYLFEQVTLLPGMEYNGFIKIEDPQTMDNDGQYLTNGAFNLIRVSDGP